MLWNLGEFLQHCLIAYCSMACIHAFLYTNRAMPKDVRRLFLILTTVLMLESLESYFDTRLYLFAHENVAVWRIIVSSIGYCLRPFMLYTVMLIIMRNVNRKYKEILLAIPTIITALLCIPAFFTKWVFWYDDDNGFHSGPLRYAIFAMLFVYFIMLLASAIKDFKKRGKESFVIFGVIFLLAMDWIMVLVFDVVNLHLTLEALSALLYFMYFVSVFHAKRIEEKDLERMNSERLLTKVMLDQSIETLAYTIDAKDKYTKGHSSRVAKYSRMIATILNKSEEECREVYLAGLLHDIGKISISGKIINKPGKLSDEEFEIIKKHPVYGEKILQKMKSIPYLQTGALYHHERYDGKGYPNGLKGEEIPELARIIAVADAYDAMTSYRSYRPTMDQGLVKQEIWKGMGTQFDPTFAKIMIALIDADIKYENREIPGEQDEIIFDDVNTKVEWPSVPVEQSSEINMMQETDAETLAAFIFLEDHWCKPSDGIQVTNKKQKIGFHGVTREKSKYVWSAPAVLVYSSDDGKVMGPNYDELGVFMSAGYGWHAGSSEYEYSGFTKNEGFESWEKWIARNKEGLDYTLDFQLEGNMVVLTFNNDMLKMDAHLAMPEKYSKKIYVALSGEGSDVSDIKVL